MKRRGTILRACSLAAAVLCSALSPAWAQALKLTKDDVVRLLRIAVMTDWVTTECEKRYAGELAPMLLLTTESMLRSADAGDVTRFREAVRQNVAGFPTKDAACRSATDYLKSVQ